MKSFTIDKLFIAQARKAETFTYRVEHGYQTLTVGQYASGHVLINETSFTEKASDFDSNNTDKIIFVEMYCNHGGWPAFAKLLRVGDRVQFRAYENGCDAMKNQGIYVELLAVTIFRNGKSFVQEIPVSTHYSTTETLRAIK